ncbi:hypothetical protein K3495_g7521 [Podosphaera aphanis]|nr:hypothetical protein K3495_g7521 [Podosphaera aphanis]
MSSTNKQQTFSYWANDLPPNPYSNLTSSMKNLPQSHSSSPQFDSLNQPQTKSPSATYNQPAFDNLSHITLTHPDVQLQDPNSPPFDTPPIPPSTWRESSLSQLSSTLTDPDLSEESDHDIQYGIQISENDNDSDNGAEDKTVSHEAQTNQSSLPSKSESPRLDHIMTGWGPTPPIAGHKRAHLPEPIVTYRKRDRDNVYGDTNNADNNVNINETSITPLSDDLREFTPNDDNYDPLDDRVMTGWDPETQCSQSAVGGSKESTTTVLIRAYQSTKPKIHKAGKEAMTSQEAQQWRIAANEEFQSLLKTGTIKIISEKAIPQGRKPVKCKWVFKKFLADGSIEKLKQAEASWYDDARATLASLGLHPTTSDVCLYKNKESDLFVLLHVDDFQVMGPNLEKIKRLMCTLHKKYKLKPFKTDLFLGINIKETDNKLVLSHGQYARILLRRHGLHLCKPATSPIERLTEPNNSHCSKIDHKEYNSIIGGLQYLANNTRPDISFAVNHLARFLSNPSSEHLQAARRILRYILKQPDKGITFSRTKGKPILEAYSDADFAADPSSNRSTSGTLIRLASGPKSWRSHLQREVVLSTTEAEYLAATETCRQLKWIKMLLEEL